MAKDPIKLKVNKVPPFLKWDVPTPPILEYLNLNDVDQESKKCAESLSEVLRFGTHILEWLHREYYNTPAGKATTMLFAEQLRKLDALSALFKADASASAPILIRSMAETLLYFKYIFNEDSERRAKSVLFMGKIRRIEFLKELQETTPSGKRTRDLLGADATGLKFSLESEGKAIDNLNKEISSEFSDILIEYEKLKKPDKWYRLFDGPNELRELAKKVKETGVYYICYRSFNEHVHGTHIFKDEEYWKKPGINKYSVRPLKAGSLFDESFYIAIRSFTVVLDHVHINPEFFRDWFFSCKLFGFRGFENFTVKSSRGDHLDIELA
jgi:Family of unknown function (DUF5677)